MKQIGNRGKQRDGGNVSNETSTKGTVPLIESFSVINSLQVLLHIC